MAVGLLTYATRVTPGDWPAWLSNGASNYKSGIALWVLASSVCLAAVDWARVSFASRQQEKATLQKILNDFSKSLFSDKAHRNRITLFKLTTGWRVWRSALRRLPVFDKGHKWKALSRVKLHAEYLMVYIRPMEVRNRLSCAAFRVSNDPDHCEGVAGLIWDQGGQVVIPDLPRIERAEVRKLLTLEGLQTDNPIYQYAAATNSRDIRILRSCEHFARHYVGTLIRKGDGTAWGVLLLDSEDENCSFATEGELQTLNITRFNDYSRLIGKFVE